MELSLASLRLHSFCVCLVWGLGHLVPHHASLYLLPVACLTFAMVEFFGLNFLLLPYYGGATFHDAAGKLHAAAAFWLQSERRAEIFSNLALLKPVWMTPRRSGRWQASEDSSPDRGKTRILVCP